MKKFAFPIVALFCAAVFAQNPPDAAAGQGLPNAAVSEALPDAAGAQAPPASATVEALPDAADAQAAPDTATVEALPDAADAQAAPDTATVEALPDAAGVQAAPDTAALSNIAVYVTGDVQENEKKALGTYILSALVNRGYKGIERSSSFLAEVAKEMKTQMSGGVDDNQIRKIGKQYGVTFICVADITPVFRGFQVSARIVNVETAEVPFIGEAAGPLKTINDFTTLSEKVVRRMFGEPEPPRKPKTWISVGLGVFGAGSFGGGIEWSNGERVAMPYYGGGAYLFIDAKYAEAFAGYSMGGAKWESENTSDPDKLPDMKRACANAGLFVKYPVELGRVKVFPLLGIDYEYSNSAELKYESGGEYEFDGEGKHPAAKSLSAYWFRFGGGADFGLGESLYLRSELLYGFRAANEFEKRYAKYIYNDVSGSPGQGHGLVLKIGLGARF